MSLSTLTRTQSSSLPAIASIVDSSILIPFLRGVAYQRDVQRLLHDGRFVLCSVVAEEILAGARHRGMLNAYRAYFRRVELNGMLAAPSHDDWVKTGELLARYSWRWGAIEPSEHINDILIVLTARRLGAELITNNLRNMLTWARMLDPRERMVAVRSATELTGI